MFETLHLEARKEFDVDTLVCGGGPSGIAAAIAAARGGAKTMLIEREGCLGGVATSGLIGVWLGSYSRDGRLPVIEGIFSELVDRLVAVGGAKPAADDVPGGTRYAGYAPWHGRAVPFEFEAAKRVFEAAVLEAGVQLRYFTTTVAPKVEGGRIDGVFVYSKSGLEYIRAKAIVDATGDADIVSQAGCPVLLGLEDEGHKGWMSGPSLSFIVDNVDYSAYEAYCRAGDYRFRELIGTLKDAGEWSYDNIFIAFETPTPTRFFLKVGPGLDGFNGLDADELTKGMVACRQIAVEQLHAIRKHFPGFGDVTLSHTSPVMGIRSTRRIVGEYKLTVDDVQSGARFSDTIGFSGYHWDMATPGNKEQRMLNREPYGEEWTEIPYRIMVPQNIGNIIAPGRSVSAAWDVMGILRIMPACFAMGQAAGVAALSVINDGTFRDVNIEELRSQLRANGAIVDAPT